MAGEKRERVEAPKWAQVRGKLHMRLKDAADELNVPITYLRTLCRQHGYSCWPGKQMRYMNSTGRNLMEDEEEEDSPESSSRAGIAGPSKLAKIAETKKKKEVANPAPKKELVTLNLLDKVGSSSSSEDKVGSSSGSERN